MLEFYMAYATYNDLMDFTEKLFAFVADRTLGGQKITIGTEEIDLTPPWERLSLKDAVIKYTSIGANILDNRTLALEWAKSEGVQLKGDESLAKITLEIFEKIGRAHV